MTRKLSLLCLLAGWLSYAAAGQPPIVVCYPGGPVSEDEANAAMESMLRVVEKAGQWPEHSLTSVFTSRVDECRKLLAAKKPRFTITSLGQFLEQRRTHHLVPLVQPRIRGATFERYQVITLKSGPDSLDKLAGKSLGGTVLEEPEFVRKIVFAGKLDPQNTFDLKPSRQALRALRALDKGELDAVLLNGQQSAALTALELKNPIAPVFTSADIPLMGMSANSITTTPEERQRFAKALQGMCSDPDGKKLCSLFGVEAFVPADPAAFKPLIERWDQGK
ncbi:sterol transporter periplasmic substrate-binding protein BstB [Methylotetracoccus oryzae]|uniref:sterol transporter periplasmic substrate-binding protein BstB n=1 Tax=Methylotetracoccus oryzae TaxID=1919059 RepID=UPI00111AA334|nr:sterol transporter periplasmic substrate-binding protein BstB [Methylotetracoccus oryzae]